MNSILDRRTAKRIKYKATVMIEIRDTGNFHYATMNNLSGDGIYCGSDCALKLGTLITIRLDSQPFASAPKIYLGEVLRCKELEDFYDSHLYGLGIKIINTFQDREIEASRMASNFQIAFNRFDDSLHLKLYGDFDGISAHELLNLLKDKSHGTSKIHIHTEGLKDIHPFGLTTFLEGFKIMNGCADRIVFTGKKARDLALSSDHWSL